MTPPLSMTAPSAILERPVILAQGSNHRPTPHLVLDYVRVDRIAIMRRRQANCTLPLNLENHPHPPGFNPPSSCAPLSPSSAPPWTSSNHAQAELPDHRMAGAPSTVGGTPGWARAWVWAGVGGSGATGGAAEGVVVPPTQTGRING
jgi:hypothetical protein